jgi:hypothetical protein
MPIQSLLLQEGKPVMAMINFSVDAWHTAKPCLATALHL